MYEPPSPTLFEVFTAQVASLLNAMEAFFFGGNPPPLWPF